MILAYAKDIFIDYLILTEKSDSTIDGYNKVLLDFKLFLEVKQNGPVYIGDIDLMDLEEYLRFRKLKGDVSRSRNRALYILRAFYKFLSLRDIVDINIAEKLEPVKLKSDKIIYLDETEMDILIKSIDHKLIKLVVKVFLNTGLRVSELINLKVKDVNLEDRTLYIFKGKGNKDRIIPINENIYNDLLNYRNKNMKKSNMDFFFATSRTGSLSGQYINSVIRETVNKLGWEKHVTAHTLRHSFATRLVNNGAKLPAVQKLLGHSSLTTTSIYIHQGIEELEDAVNLI